MALTDTLPEFSYDEDIETNILKSSHMIAVGGTIASGEGEIAVGQALGKITASGKYAKYDDTATDGTEIGTGIALQKVDATSKDQACSMLIHGAVDESACTGVDAAFKIDLPSITFV